MKPPAFDRPIELQGNAYFISDVHLWTPANPESALREDLLIQFLTEKKADIQFLFLLGDIFDFWFEYRDVVPKGYFRLFNILYELNKQGTRILYFTGNHDMWVQKYFTEQFDCQIFRSQQLFLLNGKRCLIGHGDGLGGKQQGYKLIKSIFAFRPNQVLYSMLHPRHAFSIARFCSGKSRASHPDDVFLFKDEAEPQIQYARQILDTEEIDYFIYAHRHIPIKYQLKDHVYYFNTGDWLNNFSYLLYKPQDEMPCLCYYQKNATL